LHAIAAVSIIGAFRGPTTHDLRRRLLRFCCIEHELAMVDNRFAALASAGTSPEDFVRRALQLLESDFRALALTALTDWERLGAVDSELFLAVAALTRPSWGTWNGLLTALRETRKSLLRSADAGTRGAIERAEVLRSVLDLLDERLDKTLVERLDPLCKLTRASVPSKPRLGFLLTLPIALRNRVAHDMPSDPSWWSTAAAALRPIVEFHAERPVVGPLVERAGRAAPWFVQEGETVWTFNGVNKDRHFVLYVSPTGVARDSEAHYSEIVQAFQRLLGQAATQAADFDAMLKKYAPDDVKGVLIGDYLVGRPVGAGRSAVVHRGMQLSTGRRVAVKILRDGASEETRARFQQEARLLSQLRHPNIVFVYEFDEDVWSAPRNVSLSDEPWFKEFSKSASVKSFMAMEWIDGRTVESLIADTSNKRPTLTKITTWFHQATVALQAVHANNLIHRNIKPSNVMVTSDGDVKIMDFGTARADAAEATGGNGVGNDAGSPAYMSPEQLRAVDADAEVGPAGDIYSLCATFYELITHRRLFSHDTQPYEAVRNFKLQGRRPPRPGEFLKSLPWELETILLGGLEPEPTDRYRSMSDLGRDLQSYLDDEPIHYRRPSLLRRMQLTYRRNRAVTNVLLAASVMFAVGVMLYIRNVQYERNQAMESFRNARNAVDDLFTRVSEDTLLNQPGMQALRKELLNKTLDYYQRFLKQRADDPTLQDELAATMYRAGRLIEELDSPANAVSYHLEAMHRQESLLAAAPQDPRRRQALGDTMNALGRAYQRINNYKEAEEAYNKSIALRRKLADDEPENVEYRRVLANTIMNLGLIKQARRRDDEARAQFESAQAIRGELLARKIPLPKVERDLAKGHYGLALLAADVNDLPTARTQLTAAIDLFAKLADADPRDLEAQLNLAACLRIRGDVDDSAEIAERDYARALTIFERLVDRNPDVSEYASAQAGLLMNFAQLQDDLGRPDQALKSFVHAAEVLKGLFEKYPKTPQFRRDYAVALREAAVRHRTAGRTEQAEAELRTAVEHLTALVAEFPNEADYAAVLAATREAQKP
jgi:serine/threonine protein kinase/tetratricopeptide (TPR) repeat protein